MSYYNRNKTPCKYFQQGKCKKGNSCNFAHVYSYGGVGNNSTVQPPLEERYKSFVNPSNLDKYSQEISDDMRTAHEIQLMPLTSSYSLAQPCAINLINGRDLSPEESRFLYYQARVQNNLVPYETQMNARSNDILECIKFIKNDTRKAARYLQLATQKTQETGSSQMKDYIEFPLDLTGRSNYNSNNTRVGSGAASASSTINSFGSTGMGSTSFFGTKDGNNAAGVSQTSQFGQSPMAGGGSAFGKPSFGSGSGNSSAGGVFGQPAFGNPSNAGNAFGGAASSGNAFGAPSFGGASASTGVFGKPSFGVDTSKNPFSPGINNRDQPNPSTAFGASSSNSPFGISGSVGSATSPFGNIGLTQNASASPFATLQPGPEKSAMNTQPFGSTGISGNSSNSLPTGTNSIFGSAFGSSTSSKVEATPFGMTSFGTSSFGKGGGLNTSNNPANGSSPFGSLQNGQSTVNNSSPFGVPHFGVNSSQASNGGFTNNTTPNGESPINSPFDASSNRLKSEDVCAFNQGLPSDNEIKVQDLSDEVIRIFEADYFTLGNVPDVAPPTALVI